MGFGQNKVGMMEYYDDCLTVRGGVGRIRVERFSGGSTYLDGTVLTDHGIVEVLAQGDEDNFCLTRLDFVKDGKLYIRSWKKRYARQYICTLAKRFAAEKSQ